MCIAESPQKAWTFTLTLCASAFPVLISMAVTVRDNPLPVTSVIVNSNSTISFNDDESVEVVDVNVDCVPVLLMLCTDVVESAVVLDGGGPEIIDVERDCRVVAEEGPAVSPGIK